jgi:uncharacterized membrane protein YoaK (UPF0700 family)
MERASESIWLELIFTFIAGLLGSIGFLWFTAISTAKGLT